MTRAGMPVFYGMWFQGSSATPSPVGRGARVQGGRPGRAVPLAGTVARQCLFGWYGDNTPAKGHWHIGGLPILPERVTVPTLVVLPERDRIVPPGSAEPLARAIPGAQTMRVRKMQLVECGFAG